jgi:hypothetical protein
MPIRAEFRHLYRHQWLTVTRPRVRVGHGACDRTAGFPAHIPASARQLGEHQQSLPGDAARIRSRSFAGLVHGVNDHLSLRGSLTKTPHPGSKIGQPARRQVRLQREAMCDPDQILSARKRGQPYNDLQCLKRIPRAQTRVLDINVPEA